MPFFWRSTRWLQKCNARPISFLSAIAFGLADAHHLSDETMRFLRRPSEA